MSYSIKGERADYDSLNSNVIYEGEACQLLADGTFKLLHETDALDFEWLLREVRKAELAKDKK